MGKNKKKSLRGCVKAATQFVREIFEVPDDEQPEVVSSWGP